MVSNIRQLHAKGGESEKITINLGYIDLGRIDLLVQEGFYSNRTDFIRTAIRNQLTTHSQEVTQSIDRHTLELGLRDFSVVDLEAVKAAGEKLHIKVVGLARIAPDVTADLARATIGSITVLGALHASAEVKAALAPYLGDTASPVVTQNAPGTAARGPAVLAAATPASSPNRTAPLQASSGTAPTATPYPAQADSGSRALVMVVVAMVIVSSPPNALMVSELFGMVNSPSSNVPGLPLSTISSMSAELPFCSVKSSSPVVALKIRSSTPVNWRLMGSNPT